MLITLINAHTWYSSFTNDPTLFEVQPIDIVDTITINKKIKIQILIAQTVYHQDLLRTLPVIIGYLTCIINTFAVTNQFPAAWKHATVVPIFKSGEVDEGSNYGPISLLPNLSKIVENVVASQLSACLEGRKLHSDAQLGFRKNLSTDTSPIHVSKELF